VYPKLLVAKKKQLIEIIPSNHTRQLAKKRVGVIGNAITNYLGSSNLYKQHNEQQQKFFEDLVL
jgi:hypothetical protein